MLEIVFNIWSVISFLLNTFCAIIKFLFNPIVLPFAIILVLKGILARTQ